MHAMCARDLPPLVRAAAFCQPTWPWATGWVLVWRTSMRHWVRGQAPGDMLAAAALLADLFPAEWPPPGAARRGAGPHPPPAHMRLRAALARSFEPAAGALRRLLAAGAASESGLFRAALVRLCARASGAPPPLS